MLTDKQQPNQKNVVFSSVLTAAFHEKYLLILCMKSKSSYLLLNMFSNPNDEKSYLNWFVKRQADEECKGRYKAKQIAIECVNIITYVQNIY